MVRPALSAFSITRFSERQPIVLYSSKGALQANQHRPGPFGRPDRRLDGPRERTRRAAVCRRTGETDHVLGHELVHAFQRDILRRSGRSISTLPLWFLEGMAEYLSVGHIDPNTAMWLRDSVQQNQLPHIDQLDDPSWFPYRYGQALWVYLAGRFGEDVVAKSLKSKASGGAIGQLVAITGTDVDTLSSAWHESLRDAIRLANAGDGRTCVRDGAYGHE